jgi:predicted hotdog family 3-hydroxylacyl-ACP dehydratase
VKENMAETLPHPRIEDLLPHSGRMLLIDEILEVDTETAVSKSRVSEKWPLFDGTTVSSLMIIELVAQTCGLSNGLNRIRTQGEGSIKKGFLVGIKTARFYVDALPLGAEIITEATNRFKFEAFREIEGKARIGSDIVGEVTLQVMQASAE